MDKRPKDSIDELPNRIDITKFYRYAVFIVFAVVIAESFPQSVAVFLPPEGRDTNEFYSDFFNNERVENVLILILAYTFIIAGWLNYFKASIASPHTETRFGAARFVIDLFVIYLYYYLLKVIPTQNLHGQVFVWILPIIFGSFLLWDVLRYFEYQRRIEPDQRHGIRGRILLTATVLGVIVTAAVFYASPRGSFLYEGVSVWNFIFILWSFAAAILYRWMSRTERRLKIDKKKT